MIGYIYILSNPLMPGVIKIGKTERNPAERITELSSATGVPVPFVLEYDIFVFDLDIAEKEIHTKLDSFRVNDKREFFNVSIDIAKGIIRAKAMDSVGAQLLQYEDEDLFKIIDYIFIKRKLVKLMFR